MRAAILQCDLKLLDEEPLPPTFGERFVEDLVARAVMPSRLTARPGITLSSSALT